MGYSDENIRKAVDSVFSVYDADKNGFLDRKESRTYIRVCLQNMGIKRDPTEQENESTFTSIDTNCDGKISRE